MAVLNIIGYIRIRPIQTSRIEKSETSRPFSEYGEFGFYKDRYGRYCFDNWGIFCTISSDFKTVSLLNWGSMCLFGKITNVSKQRILPIKNKIEEYKKISKEIKRLQNIQKEILNNSRNRL